MQEFLKGIHRALGVGVGYFPVAMSFGALATGVGLSVPAAVTMSIWVYAGAAQFAALEGVKQDLFWMSIVLTMLLINLRHIPMSLASERIFNSFGLKQQLFLAHGLTDEAFALDITSKPRSHFYYFGIHILCWLSWISGTWLGCQIGAKLPVQWLSFALPSLFICLLVESIGDRLSREWLVVAIGVGLVLVTQDWGTWGFLLSILGVTCVAVVLPKIFP
ncbi:AzlC family protein [cyanobacterium TDX16]|nr:AzlC family protein [cyanobacterium TDX16]